MQFLRELVPGIHIRGKRGKTGKGRKGKKGGGKGGVLNKQTSKLSLETKGFFPIGNSRRESLCPGKCVVVWVAEVGMSHQQRRGWTKSVRALGEVLRKWWSGGALSSRDDGECHFRPWTQLGQSTKDQLRQMSIHIPGCSRHETNSTSTVEFNFFL